MTNEINNEIKNESSNNASRLQIVIGDLLNYSVFNVEKAITPKATKGYKCALRLSLSEVKGRENLREMSNGGYLINVYTLIAEVRKALDIEIIDELSDFLSSEFIGDDSCDDYALVNKVFKNSGYSMLIKLELVDTSDFNDDYDDSNDSNDESNDLFTLCITGFKVSSFSHTVTVDGDWVEVTKYC